MSQELNLLTQTAPETIYLLIGEDEDYRNEPFPKGLGEEICWCADDALDANVKYVRADKHEALEAQLQKLTEDLERAEKALEQACSLINPFAIDGQLHNSVGWCMVTDARVNHSELYDYLIQREAGEVKNGN